MSDIELRQLRSDDDLDAELDLSRRAFGPISEGRLPGLLTSIRQGIETGVILGAFDGARLVGSARYFAMQQWWQGRSMPMAGVADVKVAPEERGRGVGTAMMERMLGDIAARGYPVSALYPATSPLYRAFGWEIAGGRYEVVLPARSLRTLIGPDEAVKADERPAARLRRATSADGAAIVAVKSLVHAQLRHCGPNTRDPRDLQDRLDDPEHFAYLADDGFLSYRWARGRSEIAVEELVAAGPATARKFWQIIASHASIAATVRACLAPGDPLQLMTREPDFVVKLREGGTWMLRVVDAPAAIAARGYRAGVSVSVPFDLVDPVLPANAGRWRLEVAEGRGCLQRADDDLAPEPVRFGARGFAALFGGVAASTLRLAGLMSAGDPAADDALDAAFCGQAFLVDGW